MNKVDVTSKARDLSSMEPLEESKNLCENVQRFFELQTKLKEEQKNKTLGIKKSSKLGSFKKSIFKKEKVSKPLLRNISFIKSSLQPSKSADQIFKQNTEVIPEVSKKRASLHIAGQLIVNFQETIDEDKDSMFTSSSTTSTSTNELTINSSNTNTGASLHSERFKSLNFNKFVQIPGGLESFYRYLRTEYSHENILFWCEVERFKNTEDARVRSKLAENIFGTFMGSSANSELNLSFPVLKEVQRRIILCTFEKALFCEAQREIEILMETDSFKRYLLSDEYKNFMELNTITEVND